MNEESYSQFLLKLLAPGGNDGDVSRNNFFFPVAADDEVDVAELLRRQQLAEVVTQGAPTLQTRLVFLD